MTRSFNLADLFEGAADALGGQDAVVAGGDGVETVRLSYRELDERANRVAHLLAGLGVGAGDHVGVHLTNSAEFMEITLHGTNDSLGHGCDSSFDQNWLKQSHRLFHGTGSNQHLWHEDLVFLESLPHDVHRADHDVQDFLSRNGSVNRFLD